MDSFVTMAVQVSMKKSAVPLPCEVYRHVAVTWNNTIVICGAGHQDPYVYFHISGRWTKKITSGETPPSYWHPNAHVFNDQMFIKHKSGMYSLDLKNLAWTKVIPNGEPPSRSGIFTTSWLHHGKIYYFGCSLVEHDGFNDGLKQLFCYNISSNSWEWPRTEGDIPSKRIGAKTISTKTMVVLFSGHNPYVANGLNDLYIMDMETMRWKRVHGNIQSGEVPRGYTANRTLTCISKSRAILFGVDVYQNRELIDDCWLLDLDKALQLMEPTEIWTKIPSNLKKGHHAAVVEPISRHLWVTGGVNYHGNHSASDVLEINIIEVAPLKEIAIHRTVRDICANDPRLSEETFPRSLRHEIEAQRSEVSGHNSCMEDKKCLACLVAIEKLNL